MDLLTLVGHKMYAPKGIAALYVRDGTVPEPFVYGGGQERGLRAGTENVALAVALGKIAQLAADDLTAGAHHRIAAALPGRVRFNGPRATRLPNTLNVSIDHIRGHELLDAVPEVAASAGSACRSGEHTASPVLMAMGLPPERTLSTLRLSLGRWSTPEEIETAAHLIGKAAAAR